MYELESMAQALDMQKNLAEGANSIHASVTHGKEEKYHDSEVRIFLFPTLIAFFISLLFIF